MYQYRYTISPEEYKEAVRWRFYGDQAKKTAGMKIIDFFKRVVLFLFLGVILSYMMGVMPAAIISLTGFLVFNKKTLYYITYWQGKGKRSRINSGFDVPVQITFGETGVLYECMEVGFLQIYSMITSVVWMDDFLRINGKKGTFFIPKHVVGTDDEIRGLISFVEERIANNKQQVYVLKKVKHEVAQQYPYTFYFTRTVDELINSEAEASPVSFFSKWYWIPSRVFLWLITALFLAIVIVVTWRTRQLVAWTLPFLVILELIYVGFISRSSFTKRKKRLLKQRAQLSESELIGHQMMAFGELRFVLFTEYGYVEKLWSEICFVNDNGRDIRFVVRGGRCYLLPRKVFETEEQLEEFTAKCNLWIQEAAKRNGMKKGEC